MFNDKHFCMRGTQFRANDKVVFDLLADLIIVELDFQSTPDSFYNGYIISHLEVRWV